MTLKDWVDSSLLVRVSLVMWLVSAGLVVFVLGRIDSLVHGDLYNYNLQFSLSWATPYWGLMRFVYVALTVPGILSGLALGLDVWVRLRGNRGGGVVVRREVKPVVGGGVKVEALKGNHVVMSCPSCKKVFTKPLVMLDFAGGKTRLVNVCPYCSHILGCADEGERSLDEIQVGEVSEEEVGR
jgi:uncharacterized Zn-finger protein